MPVCGAAVRGGAVERDQVGSALASARGRIAGLVTGAMWRSQDSDIRSQCDGVFCPARLQPDIDQAKTLGRVAVAGFVVGGVGLGVGFALLATSRSKSPSEPSATTSLFVGPGTLTVKGSF